jgi:glycerophosphoryl diester phosphodiesterase
MVLSTPTIIGHRGACGYRPEHTQASYELAIELGADYIETDIVPTRDGVLICRHENELSRSTDISRRASFTSRRRRKQVDGIIQEGWFSEDFTFDEIQAIRACEPMAERDHQFDGRFGICSLAEVLALAERKRKETRGFRGLLIEIKHPTYFHRIGLDVERRLIEALEAAGCVGETAGVVVESFEVSILRRVRERTGVPIVQLLDEPAMQPADFLAVGDPRTYAQLVTPGGLAEIRTYAFGIGPGKRMIVPAHPLDSSADTRGETWLAEPTTLTDDAHAAGLEVHAWTFRKERAFLAGDYDGDALREYAHFRRLGLDGFITDFPDQAVTALRIA